MSKANNILKLSDYLLDSQRTYMRHLIHDRFPEPVDATKAQYQHEALHLAVLYGQVQDLYGTLTFLETTCQHGIAGTAPDAYLDCPETYDAYNTLAFALARPNTATNLDAPISCLMLSIPLLDFIDHLPDQKEGLAQADAFRKQWQDRPLDAPWAADQEGLAQAGTQAFTAALEDMLWVQTYDADMAALEHLVEQKAPFVEILDLLR